MRIIDNKKDYYDYIVSIRGLDNDIVYDRRNSVKLADSYLQYGQEYFYMTPLYTDKYREMKKDWWRNGKKIEYKRELKGNIYHYVLEVGNFHYLFEIERYLDDNDSKKVILIPTLIKCEEVKERRTDVPIALIPCRYSYWFYGGNSDSITFRTNGIIKNPILNGTYITGFISPEEIYDNVYNYLISIREKPIIDKRTDIQKLEGKGFDKKTSFRHPIK